MRFSQTILLAGLLVICALPAKVSAQGAGVRVILSLGAGQGSAGFSCDDCLPQKQNAPSGYFRMGVAIRPRIVAGGMGISWLQESGDGDSRTSVSAVNAFGQWFVRQGFFVGGGLGVAAIRLEEDVVQQGVPFTVVRSEYGLGFHAAAGYEYQISEHVAVTPFGTFFGTNGIEFPTIGSFNANIFVLGLGLTLN